MTQNDETPGKEVSLGVGWGVWFVGQVAPQSFSVVSGFSGFQCLS